MPGFNIGSGSGNPEQKSHVAEPRRKHRWRVTSLGDVLNAGELVYLEKANRPKFKYAEATMHHNQEEAYFAGKQTWENLSWTFYDIEQDKDVSASIARWVSTVTTSFLDVSALTVVATPAQYKKDGTLEMVKGDGSVSEQWKLYGVWPLDIDWQDLDYSSSEIQRVVVTCKVDKCVKTQ